MACRNWVMICAAWVAPAATPDPTSGASRRDCCRRHPSLRRCSSLQPQPGVSKPLSRKEVALGALHGRERKTENREPSERLAARAGRARVREAMLANPATTRGTGKKIPTDQGWDFDKWWRVADQSFCGLPRLNAMARDCEERRGFRVNLHPFLPPSGSPSLGSRAGVFPTSAAAPGGRYRRNR
ncbi:MAG: hypothetical protein RL695_2024 [Pseudomonadota bacterium]